MARVVIDPGHGGVDTGAVFGDLLEKDICLAVSKKLSVEFKRRGHVQLITRSGDYALALNRRAQLANIWSGSVFVSIHTNADRDPDGADDPEAHGSEIWIYPGSVKGRRLAQAIADQVPKHFPGRKFRGIKEANFAVLRRTAMPAVLVELAFIDTEKSWLMLVQGLQLEIARCIADGVEDYLKGEGNVGDSVGN